MYLHPIVENTPESESFDQDLDRSMKLAAQNYGQDRRLDEIVREYAYSYPNVKK